MGRNNADFHKERVMDYSVHPKTGKMHPIVELGTGPNAATYTKLGPDADMPDYADHYEERNT